MKVKEIILCKLFVKLLKLMIQNYKLVLLVCLARIMSLYYRFMSLYMEKALYGLTISGMQSADEKFHAWPLNFGLQFVKKIRNCLTKHELGLDSLQAAQNPI